VKVGVDALENALALSEKIQTAHKIPSIKKDSLNTYVYLYEGE
jgi:hypothetical protein